VRKKPSVARGPKLIIETRQPHSTITTGVRQPIVEAFVTVGNETAMTASPYCESENNRHTKKDASIALRDPVPRRPRQLGSQSGATFLTGTPAGACTASRRHPQPKTWKNFFRRRMAVIPAGLPAARLQSYVEICSDSTIIPL
jgi:hypothetical protein